MAGTLTTLQCALDPAQYRLVRGVLAHNLGECVDDLMPPASEQPQAQHSDQVRDTHSRALMTGRGYRLVTPPSSKALKT